VTVITSVNRCVCELNPACRVYMTSRPYAY
jgi:hypothetical protein